MSQRFTVNSSPIHRRFIAAYYAVVYFSERNATLETLGGGAGSLGERSRTTYGRASVVGREIHDELQVDLRHRILKAQESHPAWGRR